MRARAEQLERDRMQRDRCEISHDVRRVRLHDMKVGLGRAIGDHVRDPLIVERDRVVDKPERRAE